jgi:hypothetical protein
MLKPLGVWTGGTTSPLPGIRARVSSADGALVSPDHRLGAEGPVATIRWCAPGRLAASHPPRERGRSRGCRSRSRISTSRVWLRFLFRHGAGPLGRRRRRRLGLAGAARRSGRGPLRGPRPESDVAVSRADVPRVRGLCLGRDLVRFCFRGLRSPKTRAAPWDVGSRAVSL